jgi:hypothetical protein
MTATLMLYNVWTEDSALDKWTTSRPAALRLAKLAARWVGAVVHVSEYVETDGVTDFHAFRRVATITPPEDA